MAIKCEGFVDKDKKTVATVIYETFEDEDAFDFDEPAYFKFTGKAKCLPENIFDVELGKKLSLARAWLKRDIKYKKSIDELIEQTESILSELKNEEEKITDKIENTIAKIEELTDSTEE